jgi:hypothetical protein
MNQHKAILDYLEAHGSITTMEAFSNLGITKLSTRISEMICLGYKFRKIPTEGKNRYGEPVRYMRYEKAV